MWFHPLLTSSRASTRFCFSQMVEHDITHTSLIAKFHKVSTFQTFRIGGFGYRGVINLQSSHDHPWRNQDAWHSVQRPKVHPHNTRHPNFWIPKPVVQHIIKDPMTASFMTYHCRIGATCHHSSEWWLRVSLSGLIDSLISQDFGVSQSPTTSTTSALVKQGRQPKVNPPILKDSYRPCLVKNWEEFLLVFMYLYHIKDITWYNNDIY